MISEAEAIDLIMEARGYRWYSYYCTGSECYLNGCYVKEQTNTQGLPLWNLVKTSTDAIAECRNLSVLAEVWGSIKRGNSPDLWNLSIDFGEACIKNDRDAAFLATGEALKALKEAKHE